MESPERLSAEELGRRASAGAALLTARGAFLLAFGVGANILLARLLSPRDFGIVALGTVLITFGSFMADGGLGTGLIRRDEPPTRRELEVVNGFQIAGTIGLALVCAGIAALVGGDAVIVAAMVAALPILMLKVPSIILLERSLQYRVIATVDVAEAVAFYAWAVITVALGMGVWGFATGIAARAVVGAALMARLGPVGIVRPSLTWSVIRPLARFGAKFQATVLVNLGREQGLNVAIAAIGGVAMLGVWNLSWRVLQIPMLVFGNFGRIAYPTMARLLGAGQDPRPVIERGGAALTVIAGGLLVAISGFAPALPELVGAGWEDVPAVLLWTSIAMIVTYPVALTTSGYLFAADAGGRVLAASIASATVWFAVTLPLLPEVGAPAGGIGWCAGGLVHVTMLARSTSARSGASVFRSAGPPAVAGIVAATAGWLIADALGGSVGAGLAGLAAGELLLGATLATLRRSTLRDTRRLVSQAVGNIGGGRAETAAPR